MAQRGSEATGQQTAENLYDTRIDIRNEQRRPLVEMLNERLADALTLYTLTKQAHWNVKGKDFYQLHQLFDELADLVEGHVDMIAERATALGGRARGTVHLAARDTTLDDLPLDLVRGMDFVEALVQRYGKHSNQTRRAIEQAEDHNDQATMDLFTEITRDLDKALYFLESHLQAGQQI